MTVIQDALDFLRRWRGLWLLLAAVIFYTSAVCLIFRAVALPGIKKQAEEKAKTEYTDKLNAYVKKQEDAESEEEERKKKEKEKEDNIRRNLATKLAKALYFLRFNNDKDVKTACWCFFNRVDIETGEYAYLKTLEDVINQPNQWIEYSEDNPALDNIIDIAYGEICIWRDGEHRPCSVEFVFLSWSSSNVYLKDQLNETKNTHKWSYSA